MMLKRIVEKYDKNTRSFIKIDFKDLKKDDIFKLYENNMKPVFDKNGNNIFIARSKPYFNKRKILTIKIDSLNTKEFVYV